MANSNAIESRVNPFKAMLLTLLKEAEQSLSEYEIIQKLREQFDDLEHFQTQSTLGLFQIHFLVMNALYQLQLDLLDDELYLTVSPLQIFLSASVNRNEQAVSLDGDTTLREYYLNWENFEATDQASVDELLSGFWRSYTEYRAVGELPAVDAACKLLNVSLDEDWTSIRKSFQRLAHSCHPDRGGDAVKFIALREAYELLKCKKTYSA